MLNMVLVAQAAQMGVNIKAKKAGEECVMMMKSPTNSVRLIKIVLYLLKKRR